MRFPIERVAIRAIVSALSAAYSSIVFSAPPTDWSNIPSMTIKLFYPGQSSFEWLLSKDHKPWAAKKVARGESCVSCHEDEEEDIGNLIVSGERVEPTPVEGKQGTIHLAVQIAYDDDNAFFRFQWETRNNHPGEAHPFSRFNGNEWEHYGYPKLDKVVQEGKQPGIYEDRLSMMIDDGSVPNYATHGCWVSCHDGQRDMPGKATKEEVSKEWYLTDEFVHKYDAEPGRELTRPQMELVAAKVSIMNECYF